MATIILITELNNSHQGTLNLENMVFIRTALFTRLTLDPPKYLKITKVKELIPIGEDWHRYSNDQTQNDFDGQLDSHVVPHRSKNMASCL